jgi:hypothetical protein
MSTQFTRRLPRPTAGDPQLPARGAKQRPTDRAFVIQFDPIQDARSRLRGRVELVSTGEATRFRSLKQLVAFMVDVLRNRTVVEYRP